MPRTGRLIVALILGVAATGVLAPPPAVAAESNGGVRVMPLGASITGAGNRGRSTARRSCSSTSALGKDRSPTV